MAEGSTVEGLHGVKRPKNDIDKTKVMRNGKGSGDIVKTGKWPCAACGKGVMSNLIQCTECCEWVHRRYSDTKVPLIKVQGFRCRMCLMGRDNKDRMIGSVWNCLFLHYQTTAIYFNNIVFPSILGSTLPMAFPQHSPLS